jgi:ribosomal protein S18 acetylase RimI-like enzyme
MTLLLRRAHPDDAEALVAITQRMAAEPRNNNPPLPSEVRTVDVERQGIADMANDPHALFLLAELDGVVVGELTLKRWTKLAAASHGVMLGMAVDATHRNRGIGNALLRHALEWARGSGFVKRIELHVFARNDGAIRLYRAHGFQIEGRRLRVFEKDGEWIDDLTMALLI